MIILFGPAGSGKSVQGQMLAARMGWRWLSAGQMLRDTHDAELIKVMQAGELADPDRVNQVVGEALKKAEAIERVILDGYPRQLEQAQWLVGATPEHGRSIALVVVLEVPRAELLQRLQLRARADDNLDAIDERLNIYRHQIYPILNYLTEQNIPVVHIDGVGTVGQVHDRIFEELSSRSLVK